MAPFRNRTPLWIHLAGAAVFVAVLYGFITLDSLPGPHLIWLLGAALIGGGSQELLARWYRQTGRGPRGGPFQGSTPDRRGEREEDHS